MQITSPVFSNDGNIPAKYTCDGADINPPLEFSDVPAETKSLVLIVDDPDAPGGIWVHWTVFNINPDTRKIAESSVSIGASEGLTSFAQTGYGGPCPPSGTHHYHFQLYALDTQLDLPAGAKVEAIMNAMNNHVLAQTEMIGLYSRR